MEEREVADGVAAVVLAAGGSRRWGEGSKLLASWHDGTLVEAAVRGARQVGLDPVLVVLGDRSEEVGRAVPAGARLVPHAGWREGRASSLAAGIRALSGRREVDAAAVLLGDEPRVPASAVRAVLGAWREGGADAVRPLYRGRPGHPVVFGRDCFPALEELGGEEGVRRFLDEGPIRVRTLDLDLPAPGDVDTREDLRRLREEGSGRRPADGVGGPGGRGEDRDGGGRGSRG